MERLEEAIGLFLRLPFERRAHHRRGCFRDRTAAAREAEVLDRVPVPFQEDRVVISAKRVIAVDAIGCIRHVVKVSWIFVVVENDLLVELAKIGHQRKTSMTLWSPATSASASSFVL